MEAQSARFRICVRSAKRICFLQPIKRRFLLVSVPAHFCLYVFRESTLNFTLFFYWIKFNLRDFFSLSYIPPDDTICIFSPTSCRAITLLNWNLNLKYPEPIESHATGTILFWLDVWNKYACEGDDSCTQRPFSSWKITTTKKNDKNLLCWLWTCITGDIFYPARRAGRWLRGTKQDRF